MEIVKDIKKAAKFAGEVKDAVVDGVKTLPDDFKLAGSLIADADKAKAGEKTRADMFQKICKLIPSRVNNDTVIEAMEIMRKAQKAVKKNFDHVSANQTAFKGHEGTIKKAGGFIEDQNKYADMKFGDSNMQYSGCEIFATFNAIYNITGKHADLSKMIDAYEKDGMVLSGKFGTAPKAISDFLKKQGYKTTMTTVEKEFDDVAKKAQSLILTMYNDKDDISQEVHTVNISKGKDGFSAHNVYCNGKVIGPYASVSEVIKNINKGKARGISLIGVSK